MGEHLRAGTGASSAASPIRAATEAAMAALAELSVRGPGRGCDLALVLAKGEAADAPAAVEAVARVTAARVVVGGSALGVGTDAGELDSDVGVAVLLLRGVDPEVATGPDLRLDPAGAARALGRRLARGLGGVDGSAVLILVDSRAFQAPPFLEALAAELPPGTPVLGGGLAEAGWQPRLFTGDREGIHVSSDVAVGVVLPGVEVAWGLTQSFLPITAPLAPVVRSQRVVLSLGERLAYDVLAEAIGPDSVLWVDRGEVFLAQTRRGPDDRQHLEHLPVVGIDPAAGTLTLGADLRAHQPVVLCAGAPEREDADRADMLSRLTRRAPDAAFGLLIEDAHRRTALGSMARDSAALSAAMPGLPWLGFRATMELAGAEGRPAFFANGSLVVLFSAPSC